MDTSAVVLFASLIIGYLVLGMDGSQHNCFPVRITSYPYREGLDENGAGIGE